MKTGENHPPIFKDQCPFCHSKYIIQGDLHPKVIQYCPCCGRSLSKQMTMPSPLDAVAQSTIGPYQILRSIGKGGMGEVFLAYDTVCRRNIALKQIRSDLVEYKQIHNRFLREAHITCQLTHPAIIPIYVIQGNNNLTYYTMPFVEGETLQQVLRKTRLQEKKGEPLDHIGGSIPALIRIFITICQAIAYAHSKHVLHRDLKPENIIIGKYGEVLILDWGLAKILDPTIQEDESHDLPHLPLQYGATRIGKVVGTISYMAPERALGHPATIQTDIYSLGVILYQLLTLRTPFKRGSLEQLKKLIDQEELLDPAIVAPYRDVPKMLSQIAEKCLSKNPNHRYQTVEDLIRDLENYSEGRSEWYSVANLDPYKKEDWEFQENVLIAEHMAITHIADEAEWVSLMISQKSFSGNIKLEAEILLKSNSHGIGFLLRIPEASERVHINDGYCLWLGTDINRSTKLLRSNVEVMQAQDIFLKRNQKYRIQIEQLEQTIHFYLDDRLQFSYIAYKPLIGTHIGILSRDWDFDISTLQISVSSLSVMVNCLIVPDTFLALKDYQKALSEYRRIAYSFLGRAEGREALFRAGITLLEQARDSGLNEKEELLNLALQEFEKLHSTPGAPLEYLGKALVYQTLNEHEEEIKCYELAYRRYPKHPLLPVLQEQIMARMHEMSRYHRFATYQYILLAVRHLPSSSTSLHTQKLFTSLQKYWEPLHFILNDSSTNEVEQNLHFATQLSFWIAKPYVLLEILSEVDSASPTGVVQIGNIFFSFLALGLQSFARQQWQQIVPKLANMPSLNLIQIAVEADESHLSDAFELFFSRQMQPILKEELRTILYLMDSALDLHQTQLIHRSAEVLNSKQLSFDQQIMVDTRQIWACLIEKDWKKAKKIFQNYSNDLINNESIPLHFLYDCLMQALGGSEKTSSYFHDMLEVPYPRTWNLVSHYLNRKYYFEINWLQRAFLWEKRQLFRQLALYYHCRGEVDLAQEFELQYQGLRPHVEE